MSTGCICWAGYFNFGDPGYNYFYSALAQSMAAFLAMLGVFAVYRLEIQSGRIVDLYRGFADFCAGVAPTHAPEIRALSRDNLLKYPEERGGLKFNDYGAEVNQLKQQIKQEEVKREEVKWALFKTAAPLAFLVIWSLYLTGLGEVLSGDQARGPLLAGISFFGTIVVLCFAGQFAYQCLKGE